MKLIISKKGKLLASIQEEEKGVAYRIEFYDGRGAVLYFIGNRRAAIKRARHDACQIFQTSPGLVFVAEADELPPIDEAKDTQQK